MNRLLSVLALLLGAWTSFVSAHTIITYPGQRGNNLQSNATFPNGFQWMYPCGGMSLTTNRTKWPTTGGALGIQPGWFPGHATAFFYINMGFGPTPSNHNFPMLPVFQITGPSRDQYEGSFCLLHVPLPANTTVKAGDLATIQVIETAVHGAALFNCVDIIFADPGDEEIPEVNKGNCDNTSNIGFNQVYTIPSVSGAAGLLLSVGGWAGIYVALLIPWLGFYFFSL